MRFRVFFAALVAATVLASNGGTVHAVTCNVDGLVIVDSALGPLYLDPTPGSTPVLLPGIDAAVDVEPAGTDIFASYGGDIVRYNCDTDSYTYLVSNGVNTWLALDAARHRIYAWVGTPGAEVASYSAISGASLGSIDAPDDCSSDLTVDANGCVLCYGGSGLNRLPVAGICPTPGGVPEQVADLVTLPGTAQTAVNQSGGQIYAADSGHNCTVQIPGGSCLGGAGTLLSTSGVAVNNNGGALNGQIFASRIDMGLAEIVRQDPTSGAVTVINQGDTDTPTRMAILTPPVLCGNGVLDGGEACDAGIGGSECCTTSCTAVAANTPCDDDNACTVDTVCDGEFGTCGGGDPLNCDDGKPCTEDTCEEVLGCEHALLGANTPCNDGNQCTVGEQCDGSLDGNGCGGGTPLTCEDGDLCTRDPVCNPSLGCVGTHPFEPAPGSVVALNGSIQIQQYVDTAKNQLKVKVKGGAVAPLLLGDPITDTKLALCVRRTGTGNPIPLYSVTLNPGGVCPTKDCWKVNKPGTQITYAHKTDPTRKIIVKADAAGEKSQFQAAIKGLSLPTDCPAEVICGDDVEAWIANSAGLNWSVEFTNQPLVDEKKYKNKK